MDDASVCGHDNHACDYGGHASVVLPPGRGTPPGEHGRRLHRKYGAALSFFLAAMLGAAGVSSLHDGDAWGFAFLLMAIGMFKFGLSLWTYKQAARKIARTRTRSPTRRRRKVR